MVQFCVSRFPAQCYAAWNCYVIQLFCAQSTWSAKFHATMSQMNLFAFVCVRECINILFVSLRIYQILDDLCELDVEIVCMYKIYATTKWKIQFIFFCSLTCLFVFIWKFDSHGGEPSLITKTNEITTANTLFTHIWMRMRPVRCMKSGIIVSNVCKLLSLLRQLLLLLLLKCRRIAHTKDLASN